MAQATAVPRASEFGHDLIVPDDQDYEWLGWLVNHPQEWSEDDASAARFLIGNQRSALDGMHPMDAKRRAGAQKVIDDLEAALETYERRD